MVDTVVCRMKWTFSGWAPHQYVWPPHCPPPNTRVRTATARTYPRGGAHDAPPDLLVGWGGDTPSSILIALVAFGASILVPQALSFFVSQC